MLLTVAINSIPSTGMRRFTDDAVHNCIWVEYFNLRSILEISGKQKRYKAIQPIAAAKVSARKDHFCSLASADDFVQVFNDIRPERFLKSKTLNLGLVLLVQPLVDLMVMVLSRPDVSALRLVFGAMESPLNFGTGSPIDWQTFINLAWRSSRKDSDEILQGTITATRNQNPK